MKIKKEYGNYEILINKLSKMLERKGFVIIQNTRETPSFNTNRKHIERVLGDMKYSELQEYYCMLSYILDEE
jgi:hypothetical protein